MSFFVPQSHGLSLSPFEYWLLDIKEFGTIPLPNIRILSPQQWESNQQTTWVAVCSRVGSLPDSYCYWTLGPMAGLFEQNILRGPIPPKQQCTLLDPFIFRAHVGFVIWQGRYTYPHSLLGDNPMHICPLEFFLACCVYLKRWALDGFRSIKPNLICGDYAEWVEVSPSHENSTSSISPTKTEGKKGTCPWMVNAIHMILGFSNALTWDTWIESGSAQSCQQVNEVCAGLWINYDQFTLVLFTATVSWCLSRSPPNIGSSKVIGFDTSPYRWSNEGQLMTSVFSKFRWFNPQIFFHDTRH